MANIAQAVNVLQSPILTEGNKMVKTPTWYVFHMYKAHHDAAQIGYEDSPKVNAITSSASRKENIYTVTLTNADISTARTVKVTLQDLNGKIKSSAAKVVTGEKMNTCNTFDSPDQVIEKDLSEAVIGQKTLSWTLTQEETLAIEVNAKIEIQCRYKTADGYAGVSKLYEEKGGRILKDGVI